jgi:hypothetical protein
LVVVVLKGEVERGEKEVGGGERKFERLSSFL